MGLQSIVKASRTALVLPALEDGNELALPSDNDLREALFNLQSPLGGFAERSHGFFFAAMFGFCFLGALSVADDCHPLRREALRRHRVVTASKAQFPT